MSEHRKLFDIWEVTDDIYPLVPWRAQMINYVAHFATKQQAENYVAGVQKYREKWGANANS